MSKTPTTAAEASQLRSYIDRIGRLTEEQKALGADIKEVYAEAKSNGYDSKIIKKVIKHQNEDAEKRAEEKMLLDTYLTALGIDIE